MSTHYAQRAPENRPGVDDPTGADRSAGIVLGAAVFAMGLLAGLYYFSSIAVMPALTAADDRTLVDAMQQMIDKIENPAFFLVLFGAPALAAAAGLLADVGAADELKVSKRSAIITLSLLSFFLHENTIISNDNVYLIKTFSYYMAKSC